MREGKAMSWQSRARHKGQQEGMTRQCHASPESDTKGSKRAWKGNVGWQLYLSGGSSHLLKELINHQLLILQQHDT